MASKKRLLSKLKRLLYNVNVQYTDWLKNEALKLHEPYLDGRNYSSNIEHQLKLPADISRRKDTVIENILNKKYYTFDNALFIINPFGCSPLSGLFIFNTEKPCKVKYTIKGKRGSDNYTNCDETWTNRHKVPVLGMYDGGITHITFYLIDKNNNEIQETTIRIKLPRTGPVLRNAISIKKYEKTPVPFLMATGGYSGTNYAFDSNGNIRWYLTTPVHPYGVHVLSNGHLLVPDKRMRRPNYGNAHSVIAYEMDFLGRIYRNIYHQSGFHHWAVSREDNGNLLIATSSRYDTYMENSVDEMDKDTGKIIRTINANNIFDSTYVTRYDWAHINAFEYIPGEDAIIASYRNIHTIAKIDLNTQEIIWLLANPDFYKGTEQEAKVLAPAPGVKWFFQQHGVKILEHINTGNEKKIKITLFDNHTANRRPVNYFDDVKKSNIMVFTINEKEMSVEMNQCITVPLSITRSNVEFDKTTNSIYAMCANIKDEEVDSRAKILGYNYNTGECITDISLNNDFFVAKFLDFNLQSVQNTCNEDYPLYIGELYMPVKEKEIPEDYNEGNYLPDEIKKKLNFTLTGNILQISCKDHSLPKIFLYNKDNIYVQYFNDTEQLTKIFKEHIYTISVPLQGIDKGKYQAGIEYIDNDSNIT
ncbi:MAG: aryl-sulfate sulfotransferase [Lachnospiraceae bacterium]|nr:aryl-sulfate sulfotransferase [Lachnospiraceae bacterium]